MSNEESIAVSNCPACGHFPTQFIGGDSLKLKALRSPEVASLRDLNAELVEALEEVIDAVDRDIIRVRPSDREEFLESLTLWNRVKAKAKGASND